MPVIRGVYDGKTIRPLPTETLPEVEGEVLVDIVFPTLEASEVGTEHDATRSAQRFRDLVEQWRRETEFLSSITQMVSHPAYQQIIAMGRPALPLLLREIEARPDHWFQALRAIAGEDPVPSGAGLDEAMEAWLRWGRERGHIE